ncbi:PQQ-binding-like beta-propeller repeat protein [Halarchaeum salinum]|uniref:Pyrrolo-quinoline quinone repeat domain-containing protein n=1 Tax=Halarchaeum salinum TaxID=489912 RepID=A0AAV3S3W2_9EURY
MKRRDILTSLGAGLAATLTGCSTAVKTGYKLEKGCEPATTTPLWGQRSATRTGASFVDRPVPVETNATVGVVNVGGTNPLDTASEAPVLAGSHAITPTANGLAAHDRTTGERQWTSSLPEETGVSTTPVIACGLVIAATSNGSTYVLDLETGEQVGTIPVKGGTRPECSPVLSGSTLLVPGDGVTAYDLEAGETLWSEDPDNSVVGVCADDSFAYVTYRTAVEPGSLSLDLQSGGTEWTLNDPSAFDTPPAISNGLLYAVTNAQELVCVSAADGMVEWRHSLPEKGYARPAIAGEQVAVNAGQGDQARVFDTETGDELTTVKTGGSYTQPVFTEDALMVAGRDAGLVVLERSSLEISTHHSSVGHVASQISVGTNEAFYVPAPSGGLHHVAFEGR